MRMVQLLALQFIALPVWSAEPASFDSMLGTRVLEMLAGLAIVVLLIFGLSRLLQRMNLVSNSAARRMRVVAGLNLGSKEKVLLLEVADKHILVGVTPQAISALHTFDELPELAAEPDQSQPVQGFAAILNQVSGRRTS